MGGQILDGEQAKYKFVMADTTTVKDERQIRLVFLRWTKSIGHRIATGLRPRRKQNSAERLRSSDVFNC